LKKYGIRPGSSEAAELIHAAGGKRYVPVGVIRQGAKRFEGLAAELAEMELVETDEWGRPDESAALEAIIEAVRGRG
jgi:hypothetical protein